MPRNASGVYSKPAGTTAISGQTISSTAYNSQVDDMVSDLNTARPVVAGGTGATTLKAAREALLMIPTFDTLADLVADSTYTASMTSGQLARIRDHGGFYLAVDATNVHHTSAAGTQFRVEMPIARPEYWDVDVSGATDSTTEMNAMHAWVNNSSGPRHVICIGSILCDDLTAITRNRVRYDASSCLFTHNSAGTTMFDFEGANARVSGIEIDGNSVAGTLIEFNSTDGQLSGCEVYDTTGIGIDVTAESALLLGNEARGCGSYGIRTASANTRLIGNTADGNTDNGIYSQDANRTIFIGNRATGNGGSGGIVADSANNSVLSGNISHANTTHGFSLPHLYGDTAESALIGNVASNNTQWGFHIPNTYAECDVTGATQATPCVVTFASIAISAATQAKPVVLTATGHGKETGEMVRISGVSGMTELNTNSYRVHVVDANTLQLYDKDKFYEAAIDGTGFTAYTSGGNVNHDFSNGDRITFASIGGMTELNSGTYLAAGRTTTTINLTDTAGANIDSTGFGAYTSGGEGRSGGSAQDLSVIGNTADDPGGAFGAALIGGRLSRTADARLVVQGNNFPDDAVYYAGDNKGSSAWNRPVRFRAHLASAANNVTGNGAEWTMAGLTEDYDLTGDLNATTGVFTVPRSGWYRFGAGVGIDNTGSASQARFIFNYTDINGFTIAVVNGRILPRGGVNTEAAWYGHGESGQKYLTKGTTVHVSVIGTGLGGDTADIDGGGVNTWFEGEAVG